MASAHYPIPIPRDITTTTDVLSMLASVQKHMANIGEEFVNLKNALLPLLYVLSENQRGGGGEVPAHEEDIDDRPTVGFKCPTKRPCQKRPHKIPKAYTEEEDVDSAHIVDSALVVLPSKKKRESVTDNNNDDASRKRKRVGEATTDAAISVKELQDVMINPITLHSENVINLSLDIGEASSSSSYILQSIENVVGVLQSHLLYKKLVHKYAMERRSKKNNIIVTE